VRYIFFPVKLNVNIDMLTHRDTWLLKLISGPNYSIIIVIKI